MELEVWAKIDGISYEISSYGRVKNLKTNQIIRGGTIKKYKALRLTGHSVFYIHRLVGKYFIENPDNKPEINHLDCNTHNNHISNLAWSTRLENVSHAHRTLRFKHKFPIHDEVTISKLYHVYGLSYLRIADLFKCSWNTIRTIVDRFRGNPELWASL